MDPLTLSPTPSDATPTSDPDPLIFDLAHQPLRDLNRRLHQPIAPAQRVQILNPNGRHNIAVGVNAPIEIDILGHVGYYAAGMNQQARITIGGNAGPGVAENMMSGQVRVQGFASVAAGASAQGGLLVIEGNAGLRCGISLKGADIVVGGSVGSFSAFMAQAGRMVICGNASDAIGDSLYEAVLYIQGSINSLGADAQLQPMSETDYQTIAHLLSQAQLNHNPKAFKRIASAKQLYHWNTNAAQDY